jgi:hypothetical protein
MAVSGVSTSAPTVSFASSGITSGKSSDWRPAGGDLAQQFQSSAGGGFQVSGTQSQQLSTGYTGGGKVSYTSNPALMATLSTGQPKGIPAGGVGVAGNNSALASHLFKDKPVAPASSQTKLGQLFAPSASGSKPSPAKLSNATIGFTSGSLPKSLVPGRAFAAGSGGAFSRALDPALARSPEYHAASGRLMNLLGGMPSVEPAAQQRAWASHFPGQNKTAYMKSVEGELSKLFEPYLQKEVRAMPVPARGKDLADRTFILDRQDYVRAAESQGPGAGRAFWEKTEAVYDPRSDSIYLNGAALDPKMAKGTIAHERLHGYSKPFSAALKGDPLLQSQQIKYREGMTEFFAGMMFPGKANSYLPEQSHITDVVIPKVGMENLLRMYFGSTPPDLAPLRQIEQKPK